jgi:hypothetical protein
LIWASCLRQPPMSSYPTSFSASSSSCNNKIQSINTIIIHGNTLEILHIYTHQKQSGNLQNLCYKSYKIPNTKKTHTHTYTQKSTHVLFMEQGFGLVVRAAGWHAGDSGSILSRNALNTCGCIPLAPKAFLGWISALY